MEICVKLLALLSCLDFNHKYHISQEEEEEMYQAGVLNKEGGVAGLMLQDASHLMASKSTPLPLKRQPTLPHGPDPWPSNILEKSKPVGKAHDPLQNFRKEKENIGEKEAQKKLEAKSLEAPTKQQPQHNKSTEGVQNRPKQIETQTSTRSGDTHKLNDYNQAPQTQPKKSNSIFSENKGSQDLPTANQNLQLPGGKSEDAKTSDHRQQDDRKLELEGAPKSRKVNPLDRVVAKLSGKAEEKSSVDRKNCVQDDNDLEVCNPKAAVRNVTVSLPNLMTKEEMSEVK